MKHLNSILLVILVFLMSYGILVNNRQFREIKKDIVYLDGQIQSLGSDSDMEELKGSLSDVQDSTDEIKEKLNIQ